MSNVADFDVDSTLTWDGIHNAIRDLGLQDNVAELELNGITTITPDQSGITPEFINTVRAELVRLCGEVTGVPFSVAHGPEKPIRHLEPKNIFLIFQLLAYRIPEFEELILNPAMQTLIGYLLGPERCLSSESGFIKWQCSEQPEGERLEPIGMHADSPSPDTVPTLPLLVANTNFLLTDFACWEDGPMVVARGSHREGRHPQASDAARMTGYKAPAGSIVVFGGALQHGSIVRLNPGMRISINTFFCQPWVTPQEHLQGQFPEFATRGKLASQLVWQNSRHGWGVQGPKYMPTPFTAKTAPEDGYGALGRERHPNSQLTQTT
ncbi:MAG: phytanoyl-CoA dioxygenase family protein [Pseudomonadota bacterium]